MAIALEKGRPACHASARPVPNCREIEDAHHTRHDYYLAKSGYVSA